MSDDPNQFAKDGLEAYQRGELDRAVELFSRAQQGFAAHELHAQAAEAANNLSVVLLRVKQPEAALESVQGTPELFERLGDQARCAQAYGNLAAALEAVGDLPGAEAAYRQAESRFEQLGDQESRAHTLKALSQLQLHAGRPYEAAATFQAGLQDEQPKGLKAWLARTLLKLTSRLTGP